VQDLQAQISSAIDKLQGFGQLHPENNKDKQREPIKVSET